MAARTKQKIASNDIVSVSAIIIALASVTIAIWEGAETRKHNRLSVRPRLEIHFNVNQDTFGYSVINNGLGPAIVTGKRIFIDDEEIQYTGFSGYDEFLEKLKLKDKLVGHSAVSDGTTIRTSDSKDILLFKISEVDDLKAMLPELYGRVRIEITYTSIYNESFVCQIPR